MDMEDLYQKKRIKNRGKEMDIRFITDNEDKTRDDYKLLSVIDVKDYDIAMKMFNYMKEADIPVMINTEDLADTDGDVYYIENVLFVTPEMGGEIAECITVFVSQENIHMEALFILIVIGAILLWFLLSPLFEEIGKFTDKTIKNAVTEKIETNEEEKENM